MDIGTGRRTLHILDIRFGCGIFYILNIRFASGFFCMLEVGVHSMARQFQLAFFLLRVVGHLIDIGLILEAFADILDVAVECAVNNIARMRSRRDLFPFARLLVEVSLFNRFGCFFASSDAEHAAISMRFAFGAALVH